MNTDYIKYFITLAQVKHFGQAAERLYITQPNLSYAIATLEKELGVQLFLRKSKSVVLTNDGIRFLPYAERVLQELSDGIHALCGEATENEPIRLGFAQSYFLPQIIQRFQNTASNRKYSFSLFHQNTSQIIRDIKANKLDAGFCYYAQNEPGFRHIPVGSRQLVLIVHNSHPLAALDSVDLADAQKYPLICSSREPFIQHYIKSLFYSIGIEPKFFCETETVSAAANLVANKFGIAIVVDYPVLKNYPVKKLEIRNPEHSLFLSLCYAEDRTHPKPVRDFLDFLENASVRF